MATAPACNRAALLALYETLAPRVHRFLRDLLNDATLASDGTQETFVRAFRRVGELPPETRLVPWVFGIARFVALEMRKTRARQRLLVDDRAAANAGDEKHIVAVDPRTPEAELLGREAIIVIERGLRGLSEERRTALVLSCDHGLSYEEIATILGWSLSKVKIEIFRARELLRTTLASYRNEERGERA